VIEPVVQRGAPSVTLSVNPNSRLGRRKSIPHLQGRVMDQFPQDHAGFVGIDVAKKHLDIHLRPTGSALPSVGMLPGSMNFSRACSRCRLH
jgi:hypothetical protein